MIYGFESLPKLADDKIHQGGLQLTVETDEGATQAYRGKRLSILVVVSGDAYQWAPMLWLHFFF